MTGGIALLVVGIILVVTGTLAEQYFPSRLITAIGIIGMSGIMIGVFCIGDREKRKERLN